MFEHIVTIVDGSPTSDFAVGASITIAREIGSTLSFCLTLDPMLHEDQAGMMPFAELARGMKQKMLDKAIAQAEGGGIEGSTGTIICGDPVKGIVDTAKAHDADLIMMGLIPRVGILKPFTRGIIEGVLVQTTLPLCVVRRPARGILTHRILVPIVYDELGRIATDEAIRMAKQFKSTLVFCSVAVGADRHAALQAVEEGLETAAQQGVPAESLVVSEASQLSKSIVRDADLHGCDAIVMATHAREGLPKLVEGSVTQAVVELSDVPVVVVRKGTLVAAS